MPNRLLGILRDYRRDLLINAFAMSHVVPAPLRGTLLRLLGLTVGRRAKILARSWFGSTRVGIGAGTFVSRGCYFDALDRIDIGERCNIAAEVAFVTSTHEIGTRRRRAGRATPAPIRVGDGVWIGARATILPGVTIGDGAVVAAGALVTSDCEPDGLYVGSPARLVRTLDAG